MIRQTLRSPHGRTLETGHRTLLMGILNVTPDSFYDGGRYTATEVAVRRGLDLLAQGADLLDIGGESSRPGAEPVPLEEELRRVIPVIQELRREAPEAWISVDTYKAEVARQAVAAGADMVNDISAATLDPDMAPFLASHQVPVVLMHMQGTPRTMQQNPFYRDVVDEVYRYLESRQQALYALGLPTSQMVVDPGIGFGKRLGDNLELLKNITRFRGLNVPLLVGHSRKSLIGALLEEPRPEKRLYGTLALTAFLVMKGVEILRVHDVAENRQVVRTLEALRHEDHV